MQAIAPLYKHRSIDIEYLQAQIEQIKRQLENLKLSNSAPAYGICVGDVHSGNAHFTRQNQSNKVDFDQLFVKAAHIWVMGMNTGAVGDVIPYGWFTDDWLDQRLATAIMVINTKIKI
jgi:hypothetical protein